MPPMVRLVFRLTVDRYPSEERLLRLKVPVIGEPPEDVMEMVPAVPLLSKK